MKEKWNSDLTVFIDNQTWKSIFNTCYFTAHDNSLIWFQLRIIYQILGTGYYLYKIGLSPTPLCRKCTNNPETLMHLFDECPVVATFWTKIQEHVERKINLNLTTNFDILLGHLLSHQSKSPINILILLTKKYIFDSFRRNISLRLDGLIHRLKQFYIEEELLAILRNKHSYFQAVWEKWQPVFEQPTHWLNLEIIISSSKLLYLRFALYLFAQFWFLLLPMQNNIIPFVIFVMYLCIMI